MPFELTQSTSILSGLELIHALRAEQLTDIPDEHLIALGGNHAKRLLKQTNPQNNYWVRAWAARALYYHWHETAFEPLLEKLQDSHWRVRMNAARALSQHAGIGALDELSTALNDPHWRVREAAAIGLKRLADPEALPALENAFWDSHEKVQAAIERSLGVLEKIKRQK